MGDVWESSALIEEVWESGSTPGVEWTVVIREGDIVTGGSGVDLSDTTPQDLGTAAAGVSTEASRADHVHDITGLQATSEKNQPNGYAGLDGDGTVPDNRIPSSIARDTEIGTQITAHDGSGAAHPDIRAAVDAAVPVSAIDTDSTLAADSDTRVPSQKAVKAHVATASGLLIPKSLIDAKGDLFVGTADNTVARLPVGSNGQALVADSAQTGGVKWWTVPRAVPRIPSGRYTMGGPQGGAVNSAAFGASRVNAHWFELPQDGTIDQLALFIIGTAASSTYRLGLYLPDDTGGLPGTLLVAHSGTLSGAAGGSQTAAVSQAVSAGGVWAAVQTGPTAGATSRSYPAAYRQTIGRAAADTVLPCAVLEVARSDAALPSSLAGTSWGFYTNDTVPHGVMARYA